jgi:hypothetical protein
MPIALIGERLHFRIEDFDRANPQWFDEVSTILDLLPAFPAKDHWRETSTGNIPNKCMVYQQSFVSHPYI